MKKEIADEWADTLESGALEQTTGRLVRKVFDDGHAYCCLGVLCELAIKHGVEIQKRDYDGGNPHSDYVYTVQLQDGKYHKAGNGQTLPPLVQEWAGMKTSSGQIETLVSLTTINDSGTPFKEIAKIIRENWEIL